MAGATKRMPSRWIAYDADDYMENKRLAKLQRRQSAHPVSGNSTAQLRAVGSTNGMTDGTLDL